MYYGFLDGGVYIRMCTSTVDTGKFSSRVGSWWLLSEVFCGRCLEGAGSYGWETGAVEGMTA